jgi:catechol 2,3-dioxygenase-like lactoylglutathione lyase family enzyme
VVHHRDRLVLTTRDRDRRVDVYTRVLGMRLETFGPGCIALRFGDQKINLHEAGRELEPQAGRPAPGAAIPIEVGPVECPLRSATRPQSRRR